MFSNFPPMSILIFILLSSTASWAQGVSEATQDDLDVIQMELEKATPAPRPREEPTTEASEKQNLNDFRGLGTLSPFKEVSVIQKRFMPKTGRGQVFGGGTLITNDPFFNTLGLSFKASYFLNETWGLELNYMGLSTTERQSTKELKNVNNIATENLVYPQSFVGLDLVTVPIYGKMSWFNERITPFDLYFSLGYGITKTTADSSGTLHLATGQIFSLTKSMAFRWDFSWNFFSAKNIDGEKTTANNLFLSLGMSFFFPEANYR
ncbi:MAG: outer membrane beta-barrel domain-containing protein [Pseudobdellovibrionaceae bacterium]